MLAAAALADAPARDAASAFAAEGPPADAPPVAPDRRPSVAPDAEPCAAPPAVAGCARGGGGGGGGAAAAGSAVTRAPQLGQNLASVSIGLPHCPQNMAASLIVQDAAVRDVRSTARERRGTSDFPGRA
jgi:hypothetical protein